MTEYLSFYKVGKLGKSRGVRGEIYFFPDPGLELNLVNNSFLFIAFNGNYIPWRIESIKEGDPIRIKFFEFDSPEDLQQYIHAEVFLEKRQLKDLGIAQIQFKSQEYAYLINYELYNSKAVHLGRIEEILDFPQQEIARVVKGASVFTVPLNDALIMDLDQTEKKLVMDLPEGLIDINI